MKFITEEKKEKAPTFGQVEINQFFVQNSSLYQKSGNHCANKITDSEGWPFCVTGIPYTDVEKIDKICPKVTKIEF